QPRVALIRQTQLAGALNSLLDRDPTPEQAQMAHALLYQGVYTHPSYSEARVKHFKKLVELSMKLGQMPGVQRCQFRDVTEAHRKRFTEGEREVQTRFNQFVSQTAGQTPLTKAAKARSMGLVETALDLLLQADPSERVNPNNPRDAIGQRWMVEMLLGLGRL